MEYKYIEPTDWEFEYQLWYEFWMFWEHAFEVWNRYSDVKELYKTECDLRWQDFTNKVKNRVNYYIKIKKTDEVLKFLAFIENKWEKSLEDLFGLCQEQEKNIIITDSESSQDRIERAISLYLKETWIAINLQKNNVIAMSIGFFEWNEKERLYKYISELNLDYVSYKYWYNFFIDIFI